MLPLVRLLAPYIVWLYPIGVLVLVVYLRSWLIAGRDLRASLFSLERETAANRMRLSAAGVFSVFALLVGLSLAQFFLGRSIDINELIRPTPTYDFTLPRVVYVPTPGPGTPTTPDPETTPSPTGTRRPTSQPVTPAAAVMPTETAAPPLPPANCPDPGIQITQPGQGARIRGRVDVRGTASIPGFQFYKIELGLGENPSQWSTIGELRRSPVTDALLEVWDTSALPPGTYSLRLVVVDATGNYPPPCEVQVFVSR